MARPIEKTPMITGEDARFFVRYFVRLQQAIKTNV